MSRSNPIDTLPNPATRWFDIDGTNGEIYYWDKDKKEQVSIGAKFTFIVLDILSTVRGYSQQFKSGLYANEIRDSREQKFIVKAHKGGLVAEGLWQEIKEKVKGYGGKFSQTVYIAYKWGKGSELEIGALCFKGAALSAWVEFMKKHRGEVYSQAVQITGSAPGKTGNVEYVVPVFGLKAVSEEADAAAKKLDKEVLQPFLEAYFKRSKIAQAQPHAAEPAPDPEQDGYDAPPQEPGDGPPEEEDAPF